MGFPPPLHVHPLPIHYCLCSYLCPNWCLAGATRQLSRSPLTGIIASGGASPLGPLLRPPDPLAAGGPHRLPQRAGTPYPTSTLGSGEKMTETDLHIVHGNDSCRDPDPGFGSLQGGKKG